MCDNNDQQYIIFKKIRDNQFFNVEIKIFNEYFCNHNLF